MYGNPSLWFVIAEANGLDPSQPLKAGTRLTIPSTIESGALTADAHALYDEGDIIGSTLPNLKTPKKKGCGNILAIIIIGGETGTDLFSRVQRRVWASILGEGRKINLSPFTVVIVSAAVTAVTFGAGAAVKAAKVGDNISDAAGAVFGLFRKLRGKDRVPGELRGGQVHEAQQLAELGKSKNTAVFRPTLEQTETATFKAIVGDAKYTKGGQLKGTIFDSTEGGYLEIKGGKSELNTTYQTRLQTYKSVIDNRPYTIQTTRPVNSEFQKYLDFWGVQVTQPGIK